MEMSVRSNVIRLFYFTQNGVADVEHPTFDEVVHAVVGLDGDKLDTVSVTLENGDSMDVGGGNGDQYKCHARVQGDFYDLVNPRIAQNMRDTVSIMMNQEGNLFPNCCIVSRDVVLAAIEVFCEKGELANSLTWTSELDYVPL
jgi:hypothetical protein